MALINNHQKTKTKKRVSYDHSTVTLTKMVFISDHHKTKIKERVSYDHSIVTLTNSMEQSP
jgi:uncharacterized protein Veg